MKKYICKKDSFGLFKGRSFMDAGYVYVPNIPDVKPVEINLEEFNPRNGLLLRYGKVEIDKNLYGNLEIKDGKV